MRILLAMLLLCTCKAKASEIIWERTIKISDLISTVCDNSRNLNPEACKEAVKGCMAYMDSARMLFEQNYPSREIGIFFHCSTIESSGL